jgi:hypothetical protein
MQAPFPPETFQAGAKEELAGGHGANLSKIYKKNKSDIVLLALFRKTLHALQHSSGGA